MPNSHKHDSDKAGFIAWAAEHGQIAVQDGANMRVHPTVADGVPSGDVVLPANAEFELPRFRLSMDGII